MLIRHKKPFSLGIFLAMTFIGVLVLIFSPAFKGENGLQYADNSFNRLAKGSSYFIPKVIKTVEKADGKTFLVNVKLENPQDAQDAVKIFTLAGAKAEANGAELKLEGDLGKTLQSAVKDSDAMFQNDGKAVADRYGMEEKKAMQNWWTVLSKVEKEMKKEKKIDDSKIISEVVKKAIEPSYNFYHVEAQKVSEHAGMLSGLLVFYVAYTMWWGFAIFFMFEGIGLSMTKAKVKKEV